MLRNVVPEEAMSLESAWRIVHQPFSAAGARRVGGRSAYLPASSAGSVSMNAIAASSERRR
jgi:RES domain-containing protein